MRTFGWWVGPLKWREEWRCITMMNGGRCVMMSGTVLMQLLSVAS